MSWQSILKIFIVGTERGPVPESDLEPLGLSPSPNAAQTVLESLAAANMVRKAGFTLPNSTVPSFPLSEADTRPVCSDAAVKDLQHILSGRYAEVLPEFLELTARTKQRLPPEYLPELLEKAARDAILTEKIRTVTGPRGAWLARQHPEWHLLLTGDEADWFTATFAARKQLLRRTRARNPLLALAWLEKTWPEEKAGHKAQFLDILHIRLSPADEDLLEKAFSDKSREVRGMALRLLTLLPESRIFSETKQFFEERLAGVFLQKSKPESDAFLKKSLPDVSEETLQPWLAALPKEALGDWRNELLRLFIRQMPPDEIGPASGIAPEIWPKILDEAHHASAYVEAIVRYNDGARAGTVLQRFSLDFRHAVWQSREMTAFLTHFAPAAMDFLRKNKLALGYDNQVMLRALENLHQVWPKSLLENMLEQYRRPAYGNGEIPGWHFASVLHRAACHCHPPDATGSALVRDYLHNPPKVRPREFEDFLGIVRFRLNMHGHFQMP